MSVLRLSLSHSFLLKTKQQFVQRNIAFQKQQDVPGTPSALPQNPGLATPQEALGSINEEQYKDLNYGHRGSRQREDLMLISFQMQPVKHLTFREHVTIWHNLNMNKFDSYLFTTNRTISRSFVRKNQCSKDRENSIVDNAFTNLTFIEKCSYYVQTCV